MTCVKRYMVCRISAEIHSLHNWLSNSMAQGRPLVADSCQLANRLLAFTECESSSCSQKHTIWLDYESVKSSPHVHIPPFLRLIVILSSPLCIATSQPPPIWSPTMKFPEKKKFVKFQFSPYVIRGIILLSKYSETNKQCSFLFFSSSLIFALS